MNAYEKIIGELIPCGWKTPNTYVSKECAPLPNGPGIYLFILCFYEPDAINQDRVAYVGMSKNIAQRITGHDIRPLIERDGAWTQVWFLDCSPDQLREREEFYIRKFHPEFNLQGRVRGETWHAFGDAL